MGQGQEWGGGSQEEGVLDFGRVCTKACMCGWNTGGLGDFGEPSHCERAPAGFITLVYGFGVPDCDHSKASKLPTAASAFPKSAPYMPLYLFTCIKYNLWHTSVLTGALSLIADSLGYSSN